MGPEVLLMDEPSAFLDPRAERMLIGILAKLKQTVLVATHDYPMAEQLCSRAVVLCHGRIVADGPTRDILADRALLESAGL
jgi:cobalt/nickel transport system ATP-binding protein